MLLLSWNVNQFNQEPRLLAMINSIGSARAGIVTLQEVRSNLADEWATHLCDIGLRNQYWSGKDVPKRHLPDPPVSYHCVIASRWKVTPDDIGWRRCAPYPELLGRATVSVPDEGDIDVVTAHIPNGAGNGWKKIDTYHVLSAELFRATDSPRVLTGDFNEPKMFQESGQIETFGVEGLPVEETSTCPWTDKFGDKRPINEWRNGVLSVLGGVSHHGLRDAYRDRHGFETPAPVTHCVGRKYPRCFDHMFVSRHFNVRACGYFHEWRKPKELSDHSPMWAILHRRTDLPRLERCADGCS